MSEPRRVSTFTSSETEARKLCPSCGRWFEWRRKWANCWNQVRFCSERCRRSRACAGQVQLRNMILELLQNRNPGATICPSDVVRLIHPEDSWREYMEGARSVARVMAAEGLIEICQQGKVVDAAHARGPIRLRLMKGSDSSRP